ncbi:chemotaxis protein CheB [Luteibacter jiangsuensis]|uniref:protein-glutamate methylesterase n=1 Tax=Luteibacter jiangsuensis TaxID=637577 RepID=A0ABX0Q5C8_9GAMM|nr:chemotaxis protein CheB [Luteibacter jiangsuensis]NID04842.1 chemotaxis protein CheB [Luteibacter jiangsuensis]
MAWPSPLEALVIGASAGGVAALQTMLGSLPGSFQAPVFVVLHVPKDRPSGIPELLGGYCALPVLEADDKQPVRPGHVYFAPPDYHLLVESRDALALSMDEPVLFSRPSIDVLFESAAAVYDRGLLAILLTGASSDGSEGVAAVRAAGGKAWIQCPVEAAAPAMPNAALAHAGADAVLRLGEMCERLKGSPA